MPHTRLARKGQLRGTGIFVGHEVTSFFQTKGVASNAKIRSGEFIKASKPAVSSWVLFLKCVIRRVQLARDE